MTGPVPLWTVDEACGVFTAQGQPVDAEQLRLIIRGCRLKPQARTPTSERGGKGFALYDAGALQRIHALLIDLSPENDMTER